jgi:hypothetical protein
MRPDRFLDLTGFQNLSPKIGANKATSDRKSGSNRNEGINS